MPLWDHGEIDDDGVPVEIKRCRGALYPDSDDANDVADQELASQIPGQGCVPRHLLERGNTYDMNQIVDDTLAKSKISAIVEAVMQQKGDKVSNNRLLVREAEAVHPF